ncbi:hypothetical protein ILYODFUR_003289 [Ilyodon furcidens]|uniref:Uncharacterized protein n=1 Tax=Ilyodon furcidens TaxID=33524 RepID=A0ABV0SVA3_9TELE
MHIKDRHDHMNELRKVYLIVWGPFPRAAASVALIVSSHSLTREHIRSILNGQRKTITGLLLSCPKSTFQIKLRFSFHLEIKVPEFGGRGVRHRIQIAMFPSADKHDRDVDFIFQQYLAPAHTVKSTNLWFNDHGISLLD